MPGKTMNRVGLSIALLLLASGCAGGSEIGAVAGEQPSRSTAAETPSPSEDVVPAATVAQYASIVAKNSDISELLDRLEGCDWIGDGPLDQPGSIVCMAGIPTLEYSSSTLAVSLESAGKDGVPAYIGAPPAEIESLVTETIAVAQEVSKVARKAGNADCSESPRGRCFNLRIDVWKGLGELDRQLDAWGPYL
jgi:hypothetical protein